jgi:hypothetical protein
MRGGGGSNHSNEIEHRLTWLEMESSLHRDLSRKTDERLTRLERTTLLIITALHALAHDKLPDWAKQVSDFLKMMTTT